MEPHHVAVMTKGLYRAGQPMRMRTTDIVIAVTIGSAVLCGPAALADTDVSDAAFFENEIRPILAKRCYECHSQETGPENGELVLETVAGIAAGGTRGSILPTNDSDPGWLLRAVRYEDVDVQMPPEGKLPDAELALLERWVRTGGKLPHYNSEPRTASQSIDWNAARSFWSYRPLTHVHPPATSNRAWIRTAVDSFVLAELEKHGLASSPPADRATLIRRMSFAAIGLTPSPSEVEAFVSDQTPGATERVVDRLLASPQFGERWSRFWLDLARYTDSTPEWQSPTDRAWIYRDWVVRAFNLNLPFDQFVRLQLAADLLPNVNPTELAALGFLGLSPTYWKELRLAPAVIEQIVADEWDERLDTVSRTFLGLTVACARCHDHKFDPITMHDYYGLAGVFASTQLHERPLLPEPQASLVREAHQKILGLQDKLKAAQAMKSDEGTTKAIECQIADMRKTPGYQFPWAHVVREASVHVQPDGDEMTRLEYREGEARDLPVFRRGNPANRGEFVPRRFLQLFAAHEPCRLDQGSGRRQLADALFAASRGLVARVIVNRIWDQYFGTGLVRTTSDFGSQGERPSHPELLEYLAAELASRSWDLKWLHRQILLSSAFGQSSVTRPEASAIDPDNRLLWRASRRRLDFEMWRDAILVATGSLDTRSGGPSRPIDDPDNSRRTVYVTIHRDELHSLLRTYDFPEPSAHSPRREPTITPLQQLFVLNSPWMQRQAHVLFERIRPYPSTAARVEICYQWLLSRRPSDAEIATAENFLSANPLTRDKIDRTSAAADRRWQDYLQVMLGLNEVFFVD